jgi:hypothetical protein
VSCDIFYSFEDCVFDSVVISQTVKSLKIGTFIEFEHFLIVSVLFSSLI